MEVFVNSIFFLIYKIFYTNSQHVCSAVISLQRGVEPFCVQAVSKGGSTPKKQGDKDQQKQQLEGEQQVAIQREEYEDPMESITRLICESLAVLRMTTIFII